MDQDFHYYGTYVAARTAGWKKDDAELIARCANYVDYFTGKRFNGSWKYTCNNIPTGECKHLRISAHTDPQPQEGMWTAFHFLPGRTKDTDITFKLPPIGKKAEMHSLQEAPPPTREHPDIWRLTRPLSQLSRFMIFDNWELAKDPNQIRDILYHAVDLFGKGNNYHREGSVQKRFLKILTGIRAHVLADTWAHQDFAGIPTVLNTYYDIHAKARKLALAYNIQYTTNAADTDYKDIVLGRVNTKAPFKGMPMNPYTGVLCAVPVAVSHLGHGWMGHLPDYSFMKFKYKPDWSSDIKDTRHRDNPKVYKDAITDLHYLMSLTNLPNDKVKDIPYNDFIWIEEAIGTGWDENTGKKGKNEWYPRVCCAHHWETCISKLWWAEKPISINTLIETGAHAELKGAEIKYLKGSGSVQTKQLEICDEKTKEPTDFFLFQLAVDYHFHYVKSWLKINQNYEITDNASKAAGQLQNDVHKYVGYRVAKQSGINKMIQYEREEERKKLKKQEEEEKQKQKKEAEIKKTKKK